MSEFSPLCVFLQHILIRLSSRETPALPLFASPKVETDQSIFPRVHFDVHRA